VVTMGTWGAERCSMADSVVHVEMEDVLNSVRRLVTEDSPNESADPVQEDVCFLLTPAHRVGKRNPGFRHRAAGEETTPGTVDEPETPDQPAELGQLLSEVSSKTEPENSASADDPAEGTPPANFSAAEYQSMAEAWKSELAANVVGDESAISGGTETAITGNVTLEDRIAELEEAVMRSHDDWEPDGSEPSRKPEIQRHLYEVVNNTVSQTTDEDAKIDDPEKVAVTPAQGDEETPKVDEPEPTTPVFSHVVPDTKSTLVLVEPLSDPIEESAEQIPDAAKSEPETPVKFPDSSNEVVTEDDVFLDVEALRTMIGDLVREELRGKMGERITHNVRQMVRSEIERALLSQDD